MTTKEILQQIDLLENRMMELKDQFPYSAEIAAEHGQLTPEGVFFVEFVEYTDHYPEIVYASDSKEALLKFCEKCQTKFSFYEGLNLTHCESYNEETNTYTAIAV